MSIVNNDEDLYNDLIARLSQWKVDIRSKLTLTSRQVDYPPGLEQKVNLYKVCATASLFLPYMFPEVDAGVYLDTDTVLHDDIVRVWRHFEEFNSGQIAGVTAVSTSYGVVESGGGYWGKDESRKV